MVDQFGSEYSWSPDLVYRATYFQLGEWGRSISTRKYEERRIAADSIRYAQHAKEREYSQFLDSLKPSTSLDDHEDRATLPTDMAVHEDF